MWRFVLKLYIKANDQELPTWNWKEITKTDGWHYFLQDTIKLQWSRFWKLKKTQVNGTEHNPGIQS